jgi:hypothetical protein
MPIIILQNFKNHFFQNDQIARNKAALVLYAQEKSAIGIISAWSCGVDQIEDRLS